MQKSINPNKLALTLIEYYNEQYVIKILVKWCSISVKEAKECIKSVK